MRKNDLEERLVKFAALIIKLVSELPNEKVSNHLSGQILRSGTSPALNYAEALGAESMRDFIHKLRIVLKELRETAVCLRIFVEINYVRAENPVCKECNELISIFVASLVTANKNSAKPESRTLKADDTTS